MTNIDIHRITTEFDAILKELKEKFEAKSEKTSMINW